jgi:hypothetical protein
MFARLLLIEVHMMYNSIDPDEARRGRGGKRSGECVCDCLLKTCVQLAHFFFVDGA